MLTLRVTIAWLCQHSRRNPSCAPPVWAHPNFSEAEGPAKRSGCSLSRQTGEGQGEGHSFELRFLSDNCFCTNPKRPLAHRAAWVVRIKWTESS